MRLGNWSVLVVLGIGWFGSVSARTITVAQTGTADTEYMDEAIDLASAGDTIRVAPAASHAVSPAVGQRRPTCNSIPNTGGVSCVRFV